MKRTILFLAVFLLAGISHSEAKHRIEGFWQSTKTNLVIEIDRARDGIQVRNADGGNWRYYPEIFASSAYGDRWGKKFKILDSNELVWMENSVVRGDRFYKLGNRRDARRDDYRRYDYLERGDDFDRQLCRGEWVALNSTDVMSLQATRFGLEIRKNNSYRWRDYRAISRRKFRDSRGNTIKFLDDDELVWKSDCGRYKIYYQLRGLACRPR